MPSMFDSLVNKFNELSFVKVKRAKDMEIENIDKFSSGNDFAKTIDTFGIDPDRFYSCFLFIESTDEEKLLDFMTYLPQKIETSFRISKVFVFVPNGDNGNLRCRLSGEDDAYDFIISLHPYIPKNPQEAKTMMDNYYQEIIESICRYQNK